MGGMRDEEQPQAVFVHCQKWMQLGRMCLCVAHLISNIGSFDGTEI